MQDSAYMSPGQEGSLRSIFANLHVQQLGVHYGDWLPTYRSWRDRWCNLRFPTMDGPPAPLSSDKILENLIDTIFGLDGELSYLMGLPAAQEYLPHTHAKVCELFARNVLAHERVPPPV